MLIPIQVKDGKFLGEFAFIQDGKYLTRLIPIKDKSLKDYKMEYFSLIDDYIMHTGNNRYEVHSGFKKSANIETITKITKEEWPEILEQLRFWLLDKL